MPSKETLNFLDMIQLKFEFTAQELSDPTKMQKITGVKFTTGYDHESYKQFRDAIRRCCKKLIMHDIELNDQLNIEGVNPVSEPPLMRFDIPMGTRKISIYNSDLDIYAVMFTDPQEMQAIAYILTVWQNAWMQQTDPRAAVRQRLAEQGIYDWHDFEANKGRMELINNPFPEPA